LRLTVPFPVSDKPIEQGGLLYWVNSEAQKLFRQIRTFANALAVERKTADTAGDGAYVRIWESDAMPTNACWAVVANVVGVTKSGTAQRASYGIAGTFQSTSSTVAQVDTDTTLWSDESTAAINARFGVDTASRTVYVEVRDDGASPMRFSAVVQVNEALPS